MTTIIIKRDGANNHIEVAGTRVSLSTPGANREARIWLHKVLFPDLPTPSHLRHPEDRPAKAEHSGRRRNRKGRRKAGKLNTGATGG